MTPRPLVFKFGGELIEDRAQLADVVRAVAAIAEPGDAPLVIVHGGGREIDAALKRFEPAIVVLELGANDGLRGGSIQIPWCMLM